MAKQMYDWGDIPLEIASKIREHIELYDDYEAFLEVCSSWMLATKEFPTQYINRKHTQLPWLMLADKDYSSYRRYYSLTKHKFLKIYNPPCLSLPQTRRYFSSRGWVVSVCRNISKCVGTDNYFNITIFNPFSDNNFIIEAPLLHIIDDEAANWEDNYLLRLFGKFAISTCPNDANDIDSFVVAVGFGDRKQVAYWRPGHDDAWVVPSSWVVANSLMSNICLFEDLCFFRGELYATHFDGSVCKVVAFGDLMDHNNNHQPRVVANFGALSRINRLPADADNDDDNYYLVESESNTPSLFVIHRYIVVESREERKSSTVSFNVFKLNVDSGNFESVNSLGNQAIFLGFNSTFSVKVDDHRGCKRDCIYYTDDYWENYIHKIGRAGRDMGIYSLSEGKKLPLYQGPSQLGVINPPLWIEFSGA